MRQLPDVRLLFMGTRHPNPDIPEMRVAVEAVELAHSLGLFDKHVFFNDGWVPFTDRQNYLLDADVGVSIHVDHIETEFSFRTRVLDYFWAGLPVVVSEGDALSRLVVERGVGLAVPPADVEALAEALFAVLTDEDLRTRCRRNAVDGAQRLRVDTRRTAARRVLPEMRTMPPISAIGMSLDRRCLRPPSLFPAELSLGSGMACATTSQSPGTMLREGGVPRLSSQVRRRVSRIRTVAEAFREGASDRS